MTETMNPRDEWNHKLTLAQEMLPLISRLHREHNAVTSVYGRLLVGVTDIDIIKAHRYARRIDEKELALDETLPILRELVEMDLGTASIDLGRLAKEFKHSEEQDLRAFLDRELSDVIGTSSELEARDVVLYGFGRIGRLLYAHKDKKAESYKAYNEWKDSDVLEKKVQQAYDKPASRKAAEGLLRKIFAPEFIEAIDSGDVQFTGTENPDKTVEGIVDAALQFYNLYIISPAMEREEAKPAEGWIFDEYMDDASGPTFAYLLDVEDFYEKGPAIAGQTVSYDNFEPLLDHMLDGVRERAEGGTTAAEYRFGHAETIIPLAALLKLPGSEQGVPGDEVMDYSNSPWRGDAVSPMGANIQWDAFQNDKDETIVRMLYNEAEVPFHAGCVPIEDGSMFYTLDELEACLPLGSTSDHAQAHLASSGMSAREVIAAAIAAVFAVWALLGLGAKLVAPLLPLA